VLRGRYGLSKSAAANLAEKLGLNDSERFIFQESAEALHARSRLTRLEAQKRLLHYLQSRPEACERFLKDDEFRLIADWQHAALIELSRFPNCPDNPEWLAKRLGISAVVVRESLERLKRAGLVRVQGLRLTPGQDLLKVVTETPSSAIRQHHKQILDRAKEAIDTIPMPQREFGTLMMSADPSQIQEMKEFIREIRASFERRFGKGGDKKSVFVLSTQLFPITHEGDFS
jgi:uncharacterized protein (TIGR02147 family)